VPPIYADAAHLDAALVNLALNARDAMPGGGTIAFSVEARTVPPDDAPTDQAPGQYVVFVVADSGTGMSADVASRAIEPFFSTKGGRGSGLGLSMVYGFVQQSGGGMSIRSTPGAGTRIELFLPSRPIRRVSG
jgi:signal transduction histidine kinase